MLFLSQALPLYEQSLNMINKALDIEVDEPTKPNFTWEKTLVMTQKLKKTR